MKTYKEVKEEIRLEKLEDENKALAVLNDTFRTYSIDAETYNNPIIKGVLNNSKVIKSYVIVNGYLLQIINDKKIYNYEINGNAGKNTKVIKELNLPFSLNSTTKLINIIEGL